MKSTSTRTPLENFYWKYLRSALRDSKTFSSEDVTKIFLRALKDYFVGKAELKDVSMIATQLYYEIRDPLSFGYHHRELGNALETATEIDYVYGHINESEKAREEYEEQLASLREFYSKYKHLIEKVSK